MNQQKWKIILSLSLAIGYYILAELSRAVASTPTDVTPVWPPDGLGVAAVFCLGYELLPGVFLGSFLANIFAFIHWGDILHLIESIFAVLIIALGTTLGTFLGVFLVKRSIKNRRPFNQVKDVVLFLLYAGLIGPVFNASCGIIALVFCGHIYVDNSRFFG